MYRALLLLLVACDVDADPAEDDTAQEVVTNDLCPVAERCAAEHTERDVDGDGNIDERADYTYTDRLQPLTFEQRDADGTPTARSEHTYDADSLEQSYWIDSNADGTPEITVQYTWTDLEDGTLSLDYVQTATEGPSSVATILYDADFRTLSSVITQTLGSASVTIREAWTYDARGHKLSYRVMLDPPQRSFEELSTWDTEGRNTGITLRYLDDDSPSRSVTTTWDGCNKASTATLDDGEVTNCTFTYDERGRRTRYVCRAKGGALQYNEAWTWDAEHDYRVAIDEDGDEQPDQVNHHVEDDHGNTLLFERFDADGVLLTSSSAAWICE